MVEVEKGPLRSLQQDPPPGANRRMEHLRRVGDERPQPLPEPHVVADDLLRVEGEPVVDLRENRVLLAQRHLELLAEDLLVGEVLHAQADAGGLVRVRRPDPALRGPQPRPPQEPFRDTVQLEVVGHDHVRVRGDEQP